MGLHFDTTFFAPKAKQNELDKKLALVGGHAKVTPYNIVLELCADHLIHIHQRYTTFLPGSGESTKPFYHLDVSIQVPGCHDLFDGALGQTFQCKYLTEKFTFK